MYTAQTYKAFFPGNLVAISWSGLNRFSRETYFNGFIGNSYVLFKDEEFHPYAKHVDIDKSLRDFQIHFVENYQERVIDEYFDVLVESFDVKEEKREEFRSVIKTYAENGDANHKDFIEQNIFTFETPQNHDEAKEGFIKHLSRLAEICLPEIDGRFNKTRADNVGQDMRMFAIIEATTNLIVRRIKLKFSQMGVHVVADNKKIAIKFADGAGKTVTMKPGRFIKKYISSAIDDRIINGFVESMNETYSDLLTEYFIHEGNTRDHFKWAYMTQIAKSSTTPRASSFEKPLGTSCMRWPVVVPGSDVFTEEYCRNFAETSSTSTKVEIAKLGVHPAESFSTESWRVIYITNSENPFDDKAKCYGRCVLNVLNFEEGSFPEDRYYKTVSGLRVSMMPVYGVSATVQDMLRTEIKNRHGIVNDDESLSEAPWVTSFDPAHQAAAWIKQGCRNMPGTMSRKIKSYTHLNLFSNATGNQLTTNSEYSRLTAYTSEIYALFPYIDKMSSEMLSFATTDVLPGDDGSFGASRDIRHITEEIPIYAIVCSRSNFIIPSDCRYVPTVDSSNYRGSSAIYRRDLLKKHSEITGWSTERRNGFTIPMTDEDGVRMAVFVNMGELNQMRDGSKIVHDGKQFSFATIDGREELLAGSETAEPITTVPVRLTIEAPGRFNYREFPKVTVFSQKQAEMFFSNDMTDYKMVDGKFISVVIDKFTFDKCFSEANVDWKLSSDGLLANEEAIKLCLDYVKSMINQ